MITTYFEISGLTIS